MIAEQCEESFYLPGTTLLDTETPFGDVHDLTLIQMECFSILLLNEILTN